LSDHLRTIGKNLVEDPNSANPIQYIQSIFNLKERFGLFLEKSFDSNNGFKKTIQTDFEYFFNLNEHSAKCLTLYIDEKLKKGRNTLTDAEIERFMDKAMLLFKFLSDKDIFEKYYKLHLAKRLLAERSISDDVEKSMLTRLRVECGCDFTNKLQRMMGDVNMKDDVSSQFRESPEGEDCIEMTVMVLTTGVWPTFQQVDFGIPAAIKQSIDQFTTFYQHRHNGRRLSFMLTNSRGEVGSNCFPKRYTFMATVPQISILYAFNGPTEHALAQLEDSLNMDRRHLVAALQAIVKSNLLRITQGTLENGDAVLELNDQFQSKKYKVDLTKVTGKADTKQETEAIQNAVEDDRRHVIQAAIVRIMKTRKVLKHSLLISEVLSQLTSRFNPKVPLIKKSIEALIEREYLKRTADDHELLEYIS